MIRPALIIGICIILCVQNTHAQSRIAPEKPKLIIGLLIDNLKPEFIEKYSSHFQPDGWKKLSSEGVLIRQLQHDYHIRQAAPALASLVSGSHPSIHGIIADEWFDKQQKELISACYDPKYQGIGNSTLAGNLSPKMLDGISIFDQLNLFTEGKSKIFSIAPDACSAILMGAYTANFAFWFDSYTGNWVSNNYYNKTLPLWVQNFNNKNLPATYLEKTWSKVYPDPMYLNQFNRKNKFEKGFLKSNNEFPYELSKLIDEKHPFDLLFKTPFGSTFLFDFAINCIVNENLGNDENSDVILISFPTLLNIETQFSGFSEEIQDAIFRFDQDLAYFLSFVEKEFGKENVLVFVSSPGTLAPNKEFMHEQKLPAGELDSDRLVTLLKAYLNAEFGPGEWIDRYSNENIYLNRELINSSNLSLREVQDKSAFILEQMDAVYLANTAINLGTIEYQLGANRNLQASFYPNRSGDVFIELKKNYYLKQNPYRPKTTYTPQHTYLYWWGWKLKRNKIIRPVSICDIAPTLGELLQISPPKGTSGKVIHEIIP